MKTKTFLPIFTGLYDNPYYDADQQEESEISYINEKRDELGLDEISYEDVTFDYQKYHKELAEKICDEVADLMSDFIKGITFEELIQPRYYNFSNDSINCEIEFDKDVILKYLDTWSEEFAEYLSDNYTSYDGFISRYSTNPSVWLSNNALEDAHMCGSVFNFIAKNEGIDESEIDVSEVLLEATNFDELIAEPEKLNHIQDSRNKYYKKGNKLIAEFLGAAALPDCSYDMYGIISTIEDDVDEQHVYFPEEMKFHQDWNWLMEAVNKINNLTDEENDGYACHPHQVEICSTETKITNTEICENVNQMLDNTFFAVVEFLIEYN